MICLKRVNKYCNDDIALIENYENAINDKTQSWVCHHRLEIELNVSQQYLIDNNLFFNRPASELIFLIPSEHTRLHNLNRRTETTLKRSQSFKGENNPMYGINPLSKMSPESIKIRGQKLSKSLKGKNKGKHRVYREDGSYYMAYNDE